MEPDFQDIYTGGGYGSFGDNTTQFDASGNSFVNPRGYEKNMIMGTLREIADSLKSVTMHMVSAASTISSVTRNATGGFMQSMNMQPVIPFQQGNDLGRYVGSTTFAGSFAGATGLYNPPYISRSDYMDMARDDLAKRATGFGIGAAKYSAEMFMGAKFASAIAPAVSGLLGGGTAAGVAGGVASFMTGYPIAALIANRAVKGASEAMVLDSVIKNVSAISGINDSVTRRGYGVSGRSAIGNQLRNSDLVSGGHMGIGNMADIMVAGAEEGMWTGSQNPDDFARKVKSAARQIRGIMSTMRDVDVKGAISDMATFKQWGVGVESMTGFASHMEAVGRSAGLTSKGMMQYAAYGVQMGQQAGFAPAFGANLGMMGATAGMSIAQNQQLDPRTIAMLGGNMAAGQRIAQSTASFMGGSPIAMSAIGAIFQNGKLNQGIYEQILKGDMSVDRMRDLAVGNLGRNPQMRADLKQDPGKFTEQLGASGAQNLMMALAEGVAKNLSRSGMNSDLSRQIGYTKIYGDRQLGAAAMGLHDSPEWERNLEAIHRRESFDKLQAQPIPGSIRWNEMKNKMLMRGEGGLVNRIGSLTNKIQGFISNTIEEVGPNIREELTGRRDVMTSSIVPKSYYTDLSAEERRTADKEVSAINRSLEKPSTWSEMDENDISKTLTRPPIGETGEGRMARRAGSVKMLTNLNPLMKELRGVSVSNRLDTLYRSKDKDDRATVQAVERIYGTKGWRQTAIAMKRNLTQEEISKNLGAEDYNKLMAGELGADYSRAQALQLTNQRVSERSIDTALSGALEAAGTKPLAYYNKMKGVLKEFSPQLYKDNAMEHMGPLIMATKYGERLSNGEVVSELKGVPEKDKALAIEYYQKMNRSGNTPEAIEKFSTQMRVYNEEYEKSLPAGITPGDAARLRKPSWIRKAGASAFNVIKDIGAIGSVVPLWAGLDLLDGASSDRGIVGGPGTIKSSGGTQGVTGLSAADKNAQVLARHLGETGNSVVKLSKELDRLSVKLSRISA